MWFNLLIYTFQLIPLWKKQRILSNFNDIKIIINKIKKKTIIDFKTKFLIYIIKKTFFIFIIYWFSLHNNYINFYVII